MSQDLDFDIVLIGGGIVGLASAYKITENHPHIRIAVVEKEDRLATHQTGHNSGVIHSGISRFIGKPGSVKAETCKKGREELVAFAKKHKIPHKICGKIIVAVKKKQLDTLDKIFQNGINNGIGDIEKLGPEQVKEIEPFCKGLAGIKVPCAGIIDYTAVTDKLGELIRKQSADNRIFLSNEVVKLDKHDFFTNVITNQQNIKAKYIINCAGLHSDRVAKMDHIKTDTKLVPFRGDYYELKDQAKEKVNHLIYPVPDLSRSIGIPFLGVHFTRRIDGSVECGPNAVFSFKRESYNKTDFSFSDTWDSLSSCGTWKFFVKHSIYGLAEYSSAFCKKLFVRRLQRLIPSLEPEDIQKGNSGIYAQAIDPNGRPIDDFRIIKQGNAIHILNAPSPAATACLAIGKEIESRWTSGLNSLK